MLLTISRWSKPLGDFYKSPSRWLTLRSTLNQHSRNIAAACLLTYMTALPNGIAFEQLLQNCFIVFLNGHTNLTRIVFKERRCRAYRSANTTTHTGFPATPQILHLLLSDANSKILSGYSFLWIDISSVNYWLCVGCRFSRSRLNRKSRLAKGLTKRQWPVQLPT